MDKEIEIKRGQLAKRLDATISSVGWEDIKEFLLKAYSEELEALKAGDNPAARGTIKFIEKFNTFLKNSIEFGESAKKKLTQLNSSKREG